MSTPHEPAIAIPNPLSTSELGMAQVRERKPTANPPPPPSSREEYERPGTETRTETRTKTKAKQRNVHSDAQAGSDLQPNIFVVLAMLLVFSLGLVSVVYYKIDNRYPAGPFAAWINDRFPVIDAALNRPPQATPLPMFGAAAADVTGELTFTEVELKAFDGTDREKPIYLGINGTIFDVSASPSFYGPGGHYHHFVGKDATRAWITECWDEPEQFTWRLDDVHVMFQPKYLDEMLEEFSTGKLEGDLGDLGAMPKEMLTTMARKSIRRFGSVTDAEKSKRRLTDQEEAEAKVQETLKHWVDFFVENSKYKAVGTVMRDESRPLPPRPCAKAMQKRPLKGGKLESIMGSMGNLMGGRASAGGDTGAAGRQPGNTGMGQIPAAVQEQIDAAKKKLAADTQAGVVKGQEPFEDMKLKIEDARQKAAGAAGKAKYSVENAEDQVEHIILGADEDGAEGDDLLHEEL